MDGSVIAVIAIGAINAVGWISTRVFAMGKLNGKVNSIEESVDRHEKALNDGIINEISDLKRDIGSLEGTIQTYIDLTSKG